MPNNWHSTAQTRRKKKNYDGFVLNPQKLLKIVPNNLATQTTTLAPIVIAMT